MRSAGASSPSSAERPVNVLARSSGVGESAIPFSSAEQPATSSDLKITCIRDVQRWLASEAIARYSTADLEGIREAAAALSTPKPRQEDQSGTKAAATTTRQCRTVCFEYGPTACSYGRSIQTTNCEQ